MEPVAPPAQVMLVGVTLKTKAQGRQRMSPASKTVMFKVPVLSFPFPELVVTQVKVVSKMATAWIWAPFGNPLKVKKVSTVVATKVSFLHH